MTIRVLTADPRAWRVLELLDAYTPASAGEREHLERMFDLLATTHDPLSRTQFDPGHFTASALVISRDLDCVLLIHHPTLHLWLQPGGHLEPDDASPVGGATREVFEETGIVAAIEGALLDIDIHEIPARGSAHAHLHFDLRFLATVEGLPAPSGSEGVEARWLSRDEALRLTSDESARRMIAKVV